MRALCFFVLPFIALLTIASCTSDQSARDLKSPCSSFAGLE